MKKIITITFIFLLSFVSYSQNNNIIGKWLNEDDKNAISAIEFMADKTAKMYQNNNVSPTFIYMIDNTKTPSWINLSLEKDSIKVNLIGLFEFINTETIKLEFFYDEYSERPSAFTDNPFSKTEKIFLLKRSK
jgi:hypothetical protein